MLPPKSGSSRANQLEVLASLIHEKETSKDYEQLIINAEKEGSNDPFEKQLVKLCRKSFNRSSKIPKEIVEEAAKLESEGFEIWAKARKEDKFSEFAPVLSKWIELKKKIHNHVDPNSKLLDFLIDEFDPEAKSDRIEEIFDSVKKFLVPFIQKIQNAKGKVNHDTSIIVSKDNKYDIESQKKLSERLVKDIGFSLEEGRLDTSTHPMTINIAKSDVRLTTRYKTDEFYQGLAGSIHEAGHGMYEQGLNEKYYGTPVANPHGMSAHESQSLLWERHVSLSLPFWDRYLSVVKEHFPNVISDNVTSEQVYFAINTVEPVFIRVESDEVTYPLHIILRYEIEKGLFDGSIDVEKLPEIWNQKMKDYLGIVPPNNTLGVLQDIHWAVGAFLYFPSYLVGAIISAQIFHKVGLAIPNLEQQIRDGQFGPLKTWLNQNIHEKGSLLSLDDLMVEATGEKLNPQYFFDYLTKKYSHIYQL